MKQELERVSLNSIFSVYSYRTPYGYLRTKKHVTFKRTSRAIMCKVLAYIPSAAKRVLSQTARTVGMLTPKVLDVSAQISRCAKLCAQDIP